MDPLSVTAGVVSILELLSHSCGFVTAFIRKISDCPVDIRRYQVILQALAKAIQDFHSLCTENVSHIKLSQEFSNMVAECMADFVLIEAKFRKVSKTCEQSRRRIAWARLRWSLTSEHWLGQFLSRVPHYCSAISLELQLSAVDFVHQTASNC